MRLLVALTSNWAIFDGVTSQLLKLFLEIMANGHKRHLKQCSTKKIIIWLLMITHESGVDRFLSNKTLMCVKVLYIQFD